jgi:hypothetical protein
MSVSAFGQGYTGTKTTYLYKGGQYTAAPKGYEPVFVNYVGRHGALFLTKAGSDVRVLELLTKAANEGKLTPLGDSIRAMTAAFLGIEKGNYENITLLGAAEQEGIGARLKERERAAFKGRGLAIAVTHKIRTRQSADGFLKGFADYKGKKEFMMVQDANENVLRFYDLSPAYDAYKDGVQIKQRMDSLQSDQRSSQVADAVSRRLFIASLTTKEKGIVTAGLYDLYSVQFSVVKEKEAAGAQFDFSKAFTTSELQWLDFVNSAADYLEKGPGLDTLGIQVKIAAPLVLDLITTTDAAVNGSLHKDAILRFTHAEAISPLATFMGLPGASIPAASIFHFADHWKAEEIIPLSANVQWILYSNGQHYLVKVLLNEKETALPIKTNSYPYYKWEDVRKYYLAKLKKVGVSPGDDMHKYLLEVK